MLLAGTLAALLLAGCATPVPPRDAVAALLAGRMALRVDDPGAPRPRSLTALFELAGDAAAGALRLDTPLGTRLAQARWSADGVWLDTPQGMRRFDSLDALSAETLGEVVPLAALPDWLRGRPAAGFGPVVSQADGFVQAGWTVTRASGDAAEVLLARAAGGGRPAVSIRVRLEAPAG